MAERTLYEHVGTIENRLRTLEGQAEQAEIVLAELTSKERQSLSGHRLIINGDDVYIDTNGIAKLYEVRAKDTNGLRLCEDDGEYGLIIEDDTGEVIVRSTLKAATSYGMDIEDDGGNVALKIYDGGDVGTSLIKAKSAAGLGLYADDGASGMLIEDNGNVEVLRSMKIGSAGDPGDNNLAVDGSITVGTLTVGTSSTHSSDKKAFFRDAAIYIRSNADGFLELEADDGINLSINGSKTADVDSDSINMNGSNKVQFRDSNIYIKSNDDGHLDHNADDSIDFNIAGSTIANVDSDSINMNGSNKVQFRDPDIYIKSNADGFLELEADDGINLSINGSKIADVDSDSININGSNKVQFGDSDSFIHQESDSVLKIKSDGYVEIDAPHTRPGGDKTQDLGQSDPAWDDIYCDVLHQTADLPFLDDKDDLAAINKIKSSGVIDPRTGLPIIDDNTLEEWLLSKSKDGSSILRDSAGKPYISSRTMIGLLMGAVRALDKKIDTILKK